MLKMTGLWLIPISLFLLITGCGYNDGNGQILTDNRDEYLIKNRNQTNEYMDVQNTPDNNYKENLNPHMESAQTADERQDRKRAYNGLKEQTENYVEQTIQSKVLKIPGIRGADVELEGSTVRITVDTANGNDHIALANKIKENIRLLYNYHVMVSFK